MKFLAELREVQAQHRKDRKELRTNRTSTGRRIRKHLFVIFEIFCANLWSLRR
jgi:hypothetical protein